jgi:hypothetical protein
MHHLPTHSPLNIPLQGITRMLGGRLGRQDRPALNERPIGPALYPRGAATVRVSPETRSN